MITLPAPVANLLSNGQALLVVANRFLHLPQGAVGVPQVAHERLFIVVMAQRLSSPNSELKRLHPLRRVIA